jgi:hypothetical protein
MDCPRCLLLKAYQPWELSSDVEHLPNCEGIEFEQRLEQRASNLINSYFSSPMISYNDPQTKWTLSYPRTINPIDLFQAGVFLGNLETVSTLGTPLDQQAARETLFQFCKAHNITLSLPRPPHTKSTS